MGELLGALGLAWPRLLLYPGGLFALAASWLLEGWLRRCGLGRSASAQARGRHALVGDLVPPLAALSLLPLAPARSFPFGLDLAVALLLLEWPRLRAAGPGLTREALLRDYGSLVAGALLMAEGAGGLGLSGLLTWPEAWRDRGLLGAGAALWLCGLPRLIAAGPVGLAGRLRTLGLLLIPTLPVLGLLAALSGDRMPGELAGWVLPPAAMVCTALIVGGGLGLRPRG